jgi:hypothetical protein
MSNEEEEIERKPNGQFLPGKSGNPAGRPKSTTTIWRERLASEGEAVIAKVIASALAGDMAAARLVLDRIAPPLKAIAAPVLIELPNPTTPLGTATAIIEAAAGGHLPPDTAAQLVTAVGTLARILEVEELRDRLEAIERAIKPPKSPEPQKRTKR